MICSLLRIFLKNIKFMSMKSNFFFLKELQRELKINSEGWKRQIAIVSYRIKFYFVYINASKIGLFFAKLLSYFLDFVSQSRSLPGNIFIGYGLIIPHGFNNVFITEKATLGNNITLFHNVTLGVSNLKEKNKTKIIIGNNVMIGCGTTILGKCSIGNNVTIGSNSFLINQNISENSTVIAPVSKVKKTIKS